MSMATSRWLTALWLLSALPCVLPYYGPAKVPSSFCSKAPLAGRIKATSCCPTRETRLQAITLSSLSGFLLQPGVPLRTRKLPFLSLSGSVEGAEDHGEEDKKIMQFYDKAAALLAESGGQLDSLQFGKKWKVAFPQDDLEQYRSEKGTVAQLLAMSPRFKVVGRKRSSVKTFTVTRNNTNNQSATGKPPSDNEVRRSSKGGSVNGSLGPGMVLEDVEERQSTRGYKFSVVNLNVSAHSSGTRSRSRSSLLLSDDDDEDWGDEETELVSEDDSNSGDNRVSAPTTYRTTRSVSPVRAGSPPVRTGPSAFSSSGSNSRPTASSPRPPHTPVTTGPPASATTTLIDAWSQAGMFSEADSAEEAGLKAMEAAENVGAVPDAAQFTRVIQEQARAAAGGDRRALERAFKVLDDMHKNGVRPTLLTYTALISACAKSAGAGHGVYAVDRGMQALQMMQADGVRPDVVAYNALLDTCAKAAQAGDHYGVERGFRLLSMLMDAGFKPTIITFNTLMHTCAKSSSPENPRAMKAAMDLLAIMKSSDVQPDIVSFNALVDACARGGSGGLEKALSVLDDMRASGLTPDIVTFNSLVNACARAAGLRDTSAFVTAMQVLGKMQSSGVEANVVTFNSLMTIIARAAAAGDIPDAGAALSQGTQVIGMMLSNNLAPNIVTFNALVTSIVKAGLQSGEACEEEIREGLELMEQAGVEPNSVTFVLLMDWFVAQNMSTVEAGLQTIDLLEGAGLEPDSGAYKTLIDGCVRAGKNVRSVLPVLERMRKAQCLPPTSSFNSLLAIFAKPGEGGCDTAWDLLSFMRSAEVELNDATFAILTSIRAADEASGAKKPAGAPHPFPDRWEEDYSHLYDGPLSEEEDEDDFAKWDPNNTVDWITIEQGDPGNSPYRGEQFSRMRNNMPRREASYQFSTSRMTPPPGEGTPFLYQQEEADPSTSFSDLGMEEEGDDADEDDDL